MAVFQMPVSIATATGKVVIAVFVMGSATCTVGSVSTKILILIPEATAGNISSFHRTNCFHSDSNKRLHQLQERTPAPATVKKTELPFVTVTALSMVEQPQQNFELR